MAIQFLCFEDLIQQYANKRDSVYIPLWEITCRCISRTNASLLQLGRHRFWMLVVGWWGVLPDCHVFAVIWCDVVRSRSKFMRVRRYFQFPYSTDSVQFNTHLINPVEHQSNQYSQQVFNFTIAHNSTNTFASNHLNHVCTKRRTSVSRSWDSNSRSGQCSSRSRWRRKWKGKFT